MPTKSYKILSVLYAIAALIFGALLLLAWNWPPTPGFGGDAEYGIGGIILVILMLAGAVEGWFSRTSRNVFQHLLVWAPLLLAVVFIYLASGGF